LIFEKRKITIGAVVHISLKYIWMGVRTMITRIKRKLSAIFLKSRNVTQLHKDNPVIIDENRIVIKRESLGESLPVLNELAGEEEKLIPRRKITQLKWNGSIMEIKGYFYLENIPMKDEDLVKKRFVMVDEKGNKISISLQTFQLINYQLMKKLIHCTLGLVLKEKLILLLLTRIIYHFQMVNTKRI